MTNLTARFRNHSGSIACRSGSFTGLVPLGIRLALIVFACVGLAAAQQSPEVIPRVSPKSLTAEQLAVYRVILHGWMDNELRVVHLAFQTVPLEESVPMGDEGCAKGLDLEPASPLVVHSFRSQDLPLLGSDKVGLVDPVQQAKEVEENDPEKTVSSGRSIEDAVRNAFDHGLVTLSEIRFDKGHNFAIVSYGFHCGSLCGNGGTVRLEKKDGAWLRKSRCHEWISRLVAPEFSSSGSGFVETTT